MNEEKYAEIISTCQTVQIQSGLTTDIQSKKSIMMECRICLEEHGPFIIPCRCDGTMKYVHQNCIKKWASQRLKKQVQKDEQKAKGKLSNIHGVQCQLCKQTISMQVRKLIKFIGFCKAKQTSQDYFLPFFPLLILNLIISLGCLSGVIVICTYGLFFVTKNEAIDYKQYQEHQAMIWCLLVLGLVFCVLFATKSIIQMYYMFFKEEYEVIRVVPNPMMLTAATKITQPDCPNTQWFNNLDTLLTPTSPHSVSDNLLQNKLSLTRKNITLKQKIAKQIAERKLAKIQQFRKTPKKKPAQQVAVTSSVNSGIQSVK